MKTYLFKERRKITSEQHDDDGSKSGWQDVRVVADPNCFLPMFVQVRIVPLYEEEILERISKDANAINDMREPPSNKIIRYHKMCWKL